MNKPLLATGVIFLSFGVPLVILWLVVHLYPGAGWIITWSHVWYLLVYPVLASAANSAGRLIPGRAGVVVQEVLEFAAWCATTSWPRWGRRSRPRAAAGFTSNS